MKVKITKEKRKVKVPARGAGRLFQALGATEPETAIEYIVREQVTLTQAEKKILRENDLSDAVLFTYYHRLPEWEKRTDKLTAELAHVLEGDTKVTVKSFLDPGTGRVFPSVHEMNAYVTKIQREGIPRLKMYLTEAAAGDEIIIEA